VFSVTRLRNGFQVSDGGFTYTMEPKLAAHQNLDVQPEWDALMRAFFNGMILRS
jgi:hypothetical protein